MSSSLASNRWLCFLHADLIYYFGSDEHCGNSTSLREPDTQWAFSRYLLNETMIHEQKIEKYWLSYGKPRVNIELWPFSSLQIHLFYHWFRFTHCRNIAYYFLNESEIFLFQNLPYTCWSLPTNQPSLLLPTFWALYCSWGLKPLVALLLCRNIHRSSLASLLGPAVNSKNLLLHLSDFSLHSTLLFLWVI